MDLQQVTTFLKELGIPAAISAVLLALVKAVSDALQRRSKQSLIDWLAQPSTMEPFKGDDRALRALHELQQTLVFEKAFGLKAESWLRNELLLFAESQHKSMRLHDVLDAGRLVSGLPLAQLGNPKQIKTFKIWSRIAKPSVYFGLGVGYIFFVLNLYLLFHDARQYWRSAGGGLAFVGGMILLGLYNIKNVRRFEIAAAFLGWHSENQRSSVQVQSEHIPSENNHAAQPPAQAD